MKTLDFDSRFGKIEMTIEVRSYMENGNLFVGLYSRTDDGEGFEPYTDLTKNLSVPLKVNEAYVKTFDENEGLMAFILDNKLGTVLPESRRSGFCEYPKIAFDMDKLAEFHPDGVTKHLDAYEKKHIMATRHKTDMER